MSYTLPPKYQRYADRLRELIEEGHKLVSLTVSDELGQKYIRDHGKIELHSWLAKLENILSVVFGQPSAHFKQYQKYSVNRYIEYNDDIFTLIGILNGALDDLENGFLLNQEFLVAADVFDSILDRANYLLGEKYKDEAAILCRVVLEDALKRLARANGISDTQRASKINDDLKNASFYNKPQWRQIQAWLDTGNEAAHGNFSKYSVDDVKRMSEGIEAFLATYLSV